MKQYLEIYRSQNWMLIGGKLLSKKLALWVTMNRSRNDTSLNVTKIRKDYIRTFSPPDTRKKKRSRQERK
ncbi:MAG: hypothetical protein ACOX8M_08820 [Marvinbryantia sp.]